MKIEQDMNETKVQRATGYRCEFDNAANERFTDVEVASDVSEATEFGTTKLLEMRAQGWRSFQIRDLASGKVVSPSSRVLREAGERHGMTYSVFEKGVSGNRR